MAMQWNNIRGLSVFLLGPCYQKAWLMGMRRWKRRACCCMHVLVACTLVEPQAAEVGVPCCQGTQCWWFDLIGNLDTSLVVFLRGICSGLEPSEGGIVYGLFSKEALYVGKASVNRTHCLGLAARLTEDANKPRYRLLRRRLWAVRFFPLAVFPTISQTSAAEAFAISIEAPMGNAKDAAEERRLRRRRDNAKVRALCRRPSSWTRRKRRPWESIWVVLLSKKLFQTSPGASRFSFQVRWGWTFLFALFTLLRIREEHAYCGSQGPIYWFDPCRLGLFLACCAKGSNKSNFPWIWLPRWARWETASYLYGACKQVSEFLKLPSRQRSASRVLESVAVSFSTTEKSSSISGVSRYQEYWACKAKIPRGYWSCSSMGASAFGCAHDERQEVAAVPQWQEDPPRHVRQVQGMRRRQVRRSAAQLASRAWGLEIAGVGAGRRYQF